MRRAIKELAIAPKKVYRQAPRKKVTGSSATSHSLATTPIRNSAEFRLIFKTLRQQRLLAGHASQGPG
jgi:hypothetical protein